MATKSWGRPDLTDSMFVIAIGLTAIYWILESFLNLLMGYSTSFFQLLILPGVSTVWHRLIVFCFFIIFGSHLQYTAARHREMEERLNKSEGQYQTILQSIEDAYFEVDLAGNMTFFNDATCSILGYPKDELMGMNNRAYMDKENAADIFQAFNTIYTSGTPAKGFVYEIIRKDGEKRRMEVSASLVRDANGQPSGFRAIGRDITEKKKLEAQFHQAQKMEAIGTLTGGIAHDFNNLLTVIMGNADLALAAVSKDNPIFSDIREIKTTGERAVSLTGQLLAFSRKQIIQPRTLDLNESVEGIEKMLGRLIGEDIELVMNMETNLWHNYIDPGQIDQIIMNLVLNARDAMPRGGRLIVETANVELSAGHFLSRGLNEQEGEYTMLAVSDTGIGMDEETLSHIFEPFYTTKASGKGTGLGLSTVYGIVKQNHGFIWADSKVGQGTTFRAYLPKVQEKAAREADATELTVKP